MKQHRRIDRFVEATIHEFAKWIRDNSWLGKERDCVNIFATEFIMPAVSSKSAVTNYSQVRIECGVPQPKHPDYDRHPRQASAKHAGLLATMACAVLLGACSRPTNLVERNGIFYAVNSQNPYSGAYYKEYRPHAAITFHNLKGPLNKLPEVFEIGVVRGHIEAGKKHGEFKYYYENGDLAVLEHYNHGILDGECEFRWPDGNTSVRGTFRDGMKGCRFESFHGNGQLHCVQTFKNGLLTGTVEIFGSNGALAQRSRWADGKEDGLYENFDEDGKIEERTYYKAGKKHGVYESYYSGELSKREHWADGELHGTSESFESTGVVGHRTKYENGISIESEDFDKGRLKRRERKSQDEEIVEKYDIHGRLREKWEKTRSSAKKYSYDENGNEVDSWKADESWQREAAWK
jgi:antitoxin component YwqK of YwqJK toxin-antitoxin module